MRLVIRTSAKDPTAFVSGTTRELAQRVIAELRGKGFSAAFETEAGAAPVAGNEIAIVVGLQGYHESASALCSVLCLVTEPMDIEPAELSSYDVILPAITNHGHAAPLALGVIVEAVQSVLAAQVASSPPLAEAQPASDRFTFPDALFGATTSNRVTRRWLSIILGSMTTHWFRIKTFMHQVATNAARSLPLPIQRAGRRAIGGIRGLNVERFLPQAFRSYRCSNERHHAAPSSSAPAGVDSVAVAQQNRNLELEQELSYWRTQSYRLLEELAYVQARAHNSCEPPQAEPEQARPTRPDVNTPPR